MSNIKYFSMAGQGNPVIPDIQPKDARVNAVWMDEKVIKNCMFNEAAWYKKPCKEPGLFRLNSDKMIFFTGGNPDKPDSLNATVDLWIENDRLTLTNTCAVFIPEGAAQGNLDVRDITFPFVYYTCHLNTDRFDPLPAKATAAKGAYAGNYVEKYERPDGKIPEAPPGFIKFLVYIDGKKLKGAPYAEIIWFCTTNDTGPAPHSHDDFDEFIGFIGTDPKHPEELNAEVSFYIEDEKVSIAKSCLIHIPRGLKHSPIFVPRLDKPILHFTGGNGGDYARKGDDHRNDNMFRL